MSETKSTGASLRLTSLSSCAGCASKLSARALGEMLRPVQDMFDPRDYPDLLVGLCDPDDAAVWRLDDERALVVTTDFFTPIVDDPYDYGAIAAANALSDVFAMGATPFLALNVAALPEDLPPALLGRILRGGGDKAREAGVVIAGGHTVKDKEPKYGLVVLGFVHPDRMMTKGGVQPGDAIVVTKPFGFGVTTTALKQEQADPADVQEVVGWMKTLNKSAAALAGEFGLRGGTDVTGFSLLGHGSEVARASKVALRLSLARIPFVGGAHKYAALGTFPGGASDNRSHFGPNVHFEPGIDEASQLLLFDPQTSGGLLLAVPSGRLEAFQKRAAELGQPAWAIGEALAGEGIQVVE